MSQYTFFSDEEAKGIEPETMAKLDMARKYAGVPFTITCGLRSPDSNASLVGAVSDSAHLPDANGLSHAVDFDFGGTDAGLFAAVKGLTQAGFTRIGIYFDENDKPHHIHCDTDATKPQGVIWLLKEQNC